MKGIDIKKQKTRVDDRRVKRLIIRAVHLYIFFGAMFIGSWIQLYLSELAKLDLPNEYNFMIKIGGFFVFLLTDYYNGSFSHGLLVFCMALLIILTFLLIISMYLHLKESNVEKKSYGGIIPPSIKLEGESLCIIQNSYYLMEKIFILDIWTKKREKNLEKDIEIQRNLCGVGVKATKNFIIEFHKI